MLVLISITIFVVLFLLMWFIENYVYNVNQIKIWKKESNYWKETFYIDNKKLSEQETLNKTQLETITRLEGQLEKAVDLADRKAHLEALDREYELDKKLVAKDTELELLNKKYIVALAKINNLNWAAIELQSVIRDGIKAYKDTRTEIYSGSDKS